MRVRDCMSENVVTITPEESAALAARLMTRHNLGVLAVCDYHGKYRGWSPIGTSSPAALP